MGNLFDSMTRGLTRKPNLARALIRSIASGDPHVASKVISFHAMITGLTVATIRGEAASEWRGEASEAQRTAAMILQHVWFASLVGWAGGQHDVHALGADVKARLLADRDARAIGADLQRRVEHDVELAHVLRKRQRVDHGELVARRRQRDLQIVVHDGRGGREGRC